MGVTVQVRDLDASIHRTLREEAAREGLSLSEFLRRQLTLLAGRVEVRGRAEDLEPPRNTLGGPFPELAAVDIQDIVRMTREDRDGR